jgi:hypothetical protein
LESFSFHPDVCGYKTLFLASEHHENNNKKALH